jgi:ligand-binding sensor domain-containing protein/anti-sigma regulatory factor (Ser/Thr protein kinase)
MFRRVLVPVLLICAAGRLPALDPSRTLTQYAHRIWTVQQGLPTGTIYDIWQAHDGFLWLGTQTGLVRFDGVRYTPAETIFSGVPENLWIRAGFEDEHGAMWVGTNDEGVFRFQDGRATQYSSKEGLPSDVVFCLVRGTDDGIWACTGNGLAHLSGDKIQVLRTHEGSAPDVVRAACLASGGKLWVGGEAPAIYSQNGSGFDALPLRSIPSDAAVRAMACSGDSIWVGTTAGLVQVQGATQRLYTEKDGLADDGVLSLHESRDGSLWVGTRSGFSRLRNGEFESFRPQDGLSQSSVSSLYEDREGSLWVGTKHGLNQFVDGRAIPYTVNEGLPSNAAGPLFQDGAGGIWVGTLDAGLARFDGRHFSVQGVRQGLVSDTVLALADAGGGDVWVGTARGLNLLRNGRVAGVFTRQSGLPSNEVRALYRDSAGLLWVGTAAGIAVFKDGKFTTPKGASSDPIIALGADRQRRTLFSTDHGLFRMEGETIREVAPNGVALRSVDAIYRDPDGLVWLGTNGSGLWLLDERAPRTKTTQFLMRHGMFDTEIYGIVADDLGNLWMACSKGIFSVLRSELLRFAEGKIKQVSSIQYSPTDALRVIECKPGVQPGVWRMTDGRVWFSTIRGLIVLDPAHLQRKVPPPPVVIENPIVNGQSERPDRIGSLAPGPKSLEFNYTGLSFLAPNRITFRYILDGYDKNWIDAGTRREAVYANLPPKQYRFRVTACNIDGLCNEAGSAIEFALAPHYYQQPWFLLTLAVLTAIAGWLVYQIRIRHLRERYDLIVAERSRIARELHDTLIQGFSGITMAMQALAGRLRTSQERDSLEDIIHDAANCLRETRRSVAGLREARGPEPSSSLASAIAGAARQITETKDVRLKLRLDKGSRGLPPEVEYNLLRIASEAISNSVKHSGARTIAVSLTSSPDALRLSVSDDGIGCEPQENGHLRPGHYGLIGMKERAAQIGAEFEFESTPGHGTTVSVAVPVGRSAVLEAVK